MLRHADAVIDDGNQHILCPRLRVHADITAFRRELDRVGQQIDEYLQQPLFARPYRRHGAEIGDVDHHAT